MYWIVIHTDAYGEHVNVDSSMEYARVVYERLAADDDVYSVEIYHAEFVDGTYK